LRPASAQIPPSGTTTASGQCAAGDAPGVSRAKHRRAFRKRLPRGLSQAQVTRPQQPSSMRRCVVASPRLAQQPPWAPNAVAVPWRQPQERSSRSARRARFSDDVKCTVLRRDTKSVTVPGLNLFLPRRGRVVPVPRVDRSPGKRVRAPRCRCFALPRTKGEKRTHRRR
jgi:hypothetical protein